MIFQNSSEKKLNNNPKIAIISNWNQMCGISTYTKFLTDELVKLNPNIKIFSEFKTKESNEITTEVCDNIQIVYCWRRTETIKYLKKEIKEYKPDVIMVQHEYGIFPTVVAWYNLLTFIQDYPYIVTLHSVYEHKDKFLCEAPINNIVVHTRDADNLLTKKGYLRNSIVIPHGCPTPVYEKNWNLYHTPHTVVQYGFAFPYKNFESTIKSIKLLIEKYPKIYLSCYLSESKNNLQLHEEYYKKLQLLVQELDLEENVALIRGYVSDKQLSEILKTNQVCVLPYKTHPDHDVRGSSGAAKIAMAHGIPLVIGKCHLFDDVKEIGIPSEDEPEKIAEYIDKYFSDERFKQNMITREVEYCLSNDWQVSAQRYYKFMLNVIKNFNEQDI